MIADGKQSSAEDKSSIGAGREKREKHSQEGYASCVQMRTSNYQEGRDEGDHHWNGANGDEGRDAHANRGNSRNVTGLGECHHTSHTHHHGEVTMLDAKEAAAKTRPTGEKKQRGCNSQT